MANNNNALAQIKAEIEAKVSKMTVAELRKLGPKYGVKNAKSYKRAELVEKVVDALVAEVVAKYEAKAAAKAAEAPKAVKDNSKDKRYKAVKLDDDALVKQIADDIVTNGFSRDTDPYKVNRKVLIIVMKKLRCPKWYRTYDKPTMLAMINERLGH